MPRLRRKELEDVVLALMATEGKMADDAFEMLDLIMGFRPRRPSFILGSAQQSHKFGSVDDNGDGRCARSLLWLLPTIVELTNVIARPPPRWWVLRRSAGLWNDLIPCDNAQNDHYIGLLWMRRSTFDRLVESWNHCLRSRLRNLDCRIHLRRRWHMPSTGGPMGTATDIVARVTSSLAVPRSHTMAGNGTWRDYVRERNALVQKLEKTEREVERLYKFLVARGDSISVRMQHGRAVCETEITQKCGHARRWALFVVQRLRSSRVNLQQWCDDVITEHLQTRRQLDRCRQMSEDMRIQVDQTSTALWEALVERDAVAAERGEAMAERDEVRRQLNASSRDLRVTCQQAETTWQIYNDVVYGGQTARQKFPPPARYLCDGMGCMTLHDKGKAADISTSTFAAQTSKYVSCEDLTARVSEMESEIGTSSKRGECTTCSGKLTDCPGHFGYIQLELPVYHIGYFKNIVNILQCICKNCARILLAEDDRRLFQRRFRNPRIEVLQRKALVKKVIEKCKRQRMCPYCSSVNGVVKKSSGVMKIIHDKYGKDLNLREEYMQEFQDALANNRELKSHLSKVQDDLNPSRVLGLFERMEDEDCQVLDLAQRPERLILTHLPVPPVCIRPSVEMEAAQGSNEDDITMKLMQIIEVNNIIRTGLEKGIGIVSLMENWDFLQVQCAMYINSDLPGLPLAFQPTGKPLRGFVQRLKGKQGRFRGNLSGKRVDFTGRTVISPDPNLKVTEVAVPVLMAQTLTFPEKVSKYNIEKLRQRVINGINKHPGANFVVFPDGGRWFLKFGDRRRIAADLKYGDIVERHIEDGDVVLFNRQPSLHRMSIMAHRVRVFPWRTLRFNESVCNPYNADFDGDEMNMHAPQTEEARAEALNLMGVANNLCTPKNGEILVASTQDFLTSAFLLTRKDNFYDRSMFSLLCSYMGDALDYVDLPTPAILKPMELWTGKQLFSVLVRPNAKTRIFINLTVAEKTYTKMGESMCPSDGFVYFRNSELISGQVGKATLGNGNKDGLFSVLLRDYSSEAAAACMNRMAKLSARWIGNQGFSIGIDDVQPSPRLSQEKEKQIQKGYIACGHHIDLFKKGQASGTQREFFFHTMGGREGLVDTAVKTAETGYMSRRLMKALEDLSMQYDGTVRNASGAIVQLSYGDDGMDPVHMEGKNGTPLNLERLLLKTKAQCPSRGEVSMAPGELKTKVLNRLDRPDMSPEHGCSVKFRSSLLAFLENEIGAISRARTKLGLPEAPTEKDIESNHALERTALYMRGLTRRQVEVFLETCIRRYYRKRMEPGAAVGAVGAHSIGEPGTQMTLKTFHFAGVASMNITLGVPRIKEIINAAKTISTPIITVKLVCDNDVKAARIVKGRIEKTVLEEVAEYVKTVLRPGQAYVAVKLDMKRIEALQLDIDACSVAQSIIVAPKLKLKAQVWTNLRAVMGTPGVDGRETTSNHIMEAMETLGIEAARKSIMNEIQYTMGSHGMSIDTRHSMLLADVMTFKGEVLGITRYGIAKMKDSVLMLASFEKTTDHLFDAAIHGRTDQIEGVSECIIMGIPMPLGTGMFKIRQKVIPPVLKPGPPLLLT
ncbi:hypothetical protein CBR_g21008 [Chara braunii]|uniref:DNA-directed RNA polymerase subunit n=1 Tax=Chara braunii TaxID=69332 RepID=A0A388L0B7_CHABU|nr:hypothetical protein CBR_g21008 [Chara braunii]|eukprot:GBG75764.1 hypothetical protein CBR_g21008 [Chara braunii]